MTLNQTQIKFLIPIVTMLMITSGLVPGCRKGSDSKNAPTPAASPKAQTAFERDLDFVRKGQFTYVLVFSRKDGGAFDKEDIAYLKANSPVETNQWVSSEEGKRVICGTNFDFKQEHFDALNKRFIIENFTGK